MCAFLRNDYLYSKNFFSYALLKDPEIQKLLAKKFFQLSRKSIVIGHKVLDAYEKGQQDNPFPFPHADLEIYERRAYVAGISGISNATIGQGTKHPVSTKLYQQWDAPVKRISAGYGCLAIAAGSEGLFETPPLRLYRRGYRYIEDDPVRLSDEACFSCNWTYWSIYCSNQNGGYLASFLKEVNQNEPEFEFRHAKDDHTSEPSRKFDRVIPCDEIWGQQSFTWGVRDKFCLAAGNVIKVVRYEPWNNKNQLQHLGQITIDDLERRNIVAASIAPFGIVVELDDSILVQTSTGKLFELKGEPSNWRVFPRAHHYFNQLHVIREDCLEIYSFHNDYFIEQVEKLAGLKVTSWPGSPTNFRRRTNT